MGGQARAPIASSMPEGSGAIAYEALGRSIALRGPSASLRFKIFVRPQAAVAPIGAASRKWQTGCFFRHVVLEEPLGAAFSGAIMPS